MDSCTLPVTAGTAPCPPLSAGDPTLACVACTVSTSGHQGWSLGPHSDIPALPGGGGTGGSRHSRAPGLGLRPAVPCSKYLQGPSGFPGKEPVSHTWSTMINLAWEEQHEQEKQQQ